MRRLLRLRAHRDDGVDASHPTSSPWSSRPGTVGPPPRDDARHRAARRAVARRLHPDLGGDVEQYLAALAEVDRRHGLGPDRGRAPATGSTPRRSRRSGLRRRMRQAARAARQRLPRRVPGARRYARL